MLVIDLINYKILLEIIESTVFCINYTIYLDTVFKKNSI